MEELNNTILPKGVKVVPLIDRSDLVHYTTHTVLNNLRDGIILVVIILFLFLGNVRGAIIVALTIPFSLLFAATCLNLKGIPANLLSLGALDFGMVVDGAVVMVENIVRHLSRRDQDGRTPKQKISDAAHEVQRPVFYAVAIIITAYLPIFTLAARGRAIVQAHGVDCGLCSAGRHHFFAADRARARQRFLSQRHARVAQPGDELADGGVSQGLKDCHPAALGHRRSRQLPVWQSHCIFGWAA